MAEPQPDSELHEPSSAFLRHRETGEGTFFERWQREFRQSRHPLGRALHRMVKLDELEKCSAAADYLYSRSTFQLIDDAKAISKTKTVESPQRPVVRLSDVAATLLLRVHGSYETALSEANHGIEQRLASVLSALPNTTALDDARTDRDRAASSKPRSTKDWILGEDLVDTCALAAYVVQQTRGADVLAVDLDDFVIAVLLNPAGQTLIFETFLELAVGCPPLTIGDILREVLADRSSPDSSFWDEILHEIDERSLDGASQVDLETRLPDYVADRPIERLRDDLLDFRGDARAVAEIVCQSKPGPPLAIGLFGDWGSGESSFMNLLRHEIEQLTGQARMHSGATPFVRRAAHVIFNAWQYNDTQLWPALAENTFIQLRAGGAEGRSRQVSDEVLQELTKKVESWEDTADGLALDLMQSQRDETEKRDQLLDAENERDKQIKAARDEAIQTVGKHIAKSSDSGCSTQSENATVAGFIDATETLPNATGAMRDIVNAVRIAWELKQNRWLVVLAIALALTIAGVTWFATEAWLGQIAPLLACIVWFNREVQPLMAALRTYRVKQAQAERAFRAAQRDSDLELARLQRDMRQKENKIRRQLSRAAQFKGRSPAEVLEFFLSEGAAVRALHDEVGIVSRVRRAFEQLNAVVTSHQDADDTPQRIVFYIDDLDRCRAEQVVRVLEAVHLLLAFDRFVVVVGVDTRWLETSLISFYDEQLRANRDDLSSQNSAAPDPRATVRDYVEKIFQVPIQIPRLTTDEGGTFAKLVDSLSPVAAPEQAQEVKGTADATQYDNLPPMEPLDVTIPKPERFHEAVARAQLSAKEVDLLKQLGPLAGRSPRAVKRLLNLYRLLRATRTGSRLTEFLEGTASSGWPGYPGVQLCLAIEVGLPAAQVHRFREAVIIAAGVEKTRPSELLAWPVQPKKPWSDAMAAFFESLSPTQPRGQVGVVLRTIVERFGDSPQRLQVLRDIVIETSRFSFSTLADRPLSGSASEAGLPSAIGAHNVDRVRKQRKPRPVEKAADRQAQSSSVT